MSRLAVALLLVFALAAGSGSAAAPERGSAPVAKKPCKLVTKVVKGKKVKVRVCVKAKAKCKFVTRRVKGKKKRVKVCPKAKKKQTPSRQPPPPGSPPVPAPAQQDVIARSVADRLAAATTSQAREGALLEAARALHLGVYRADGSLIVAGAERGPNDFFLYEFELAILAEALTRGDTLDLAGVAQQLDGLGIRPGGNALTAGTLGQILVSGVQSAVARPTDARSILPLLLRELGLRRLPGYDLAREIPAGARFDAFQIFLIAADAALSTSPAPARALFAFPTPVRTVSQAGPCNQGSSVGRAIGAFVWGPAGAAKELALHLLVLAMSIELHDLTAGEKSTHYGPAGHATGAGNPLRFELFASVRETIQTPGCGPLTVLVLPMTSATYRWSSALTKDGGGVLSPSHNLELHGAVRTSSGPITRQVPGGATTTFGAGSLDFDPKVEVMPGFADEKGVIGEVRAELVSANLGEHVLQAVFGPKQITWPVRVRYHKPRGFKFSGLKWRVEDRNHPNDPVANYDELEILSARICGEDPYYPSTVFYSGIWDLRVHRKRDWQGPPAIKEDQVYSPQVFFTTPEPPGALDPRPSYGLEVITGFDVTTIVQFIPGPNPRAKLVLQANNPEVNPSRTVTVTVGEVPVEEDKSCPEND